VASEEHWNQGVKGKKPEPTVAADDLPVPTGDEAPAPTEEAPASAPQQ
jgi:hypothetical protein